MPDRRDSAERASVVVRKDAPELEAFAAGELCRYLRQCFGVEAFVAHDSPPESDAYFLVGPPPTGGTLAAVVARRPVPQMSDQGFLLRRLLFRGKRALLLCGGSPRATLWAVYELAERWGVRYLLHGDVLPRRARMWLPDIDLMAEPKLKIRQWRVINDFACGPESWGLADYRPVIDQLAKLKFNRIFACVYAYQPFLHFAARGVTRSWATLWFGFRYPLGSDTIGRELFDDRPEFWNPDLPLGATYAELTAAAREHLQGVMEYACSRGMDCVMSAYLTEFPPEFAAALGDVEQCWPSFGALTVVPGGSIRPDDPALLELAGAVLKAAVDTYPAVSAVCLGMPEMRTWRPDHVEAWRELDRKYAIERFASLASVLAAARRRTIYPGGADRALREVEGDIVNLYFYDRVLEASHALRSTGRADIRVIWDSVAEELFPILPAISKPGWESQNAVDYTSSNILRRKEVLGTLPADRQPSTLILTLHDDNVGLLPQLTARALHELCAELKRNGWAGFSTRYWMIGDHDTAVASIARAAWDDAATPEAVTADQVKAVCGAAAVTDMLRVFDRVQRATFILEQHALGFCFPVPGMLMRHWKAAPLESTIADVRRHYQEALASASRAMRRTKPAGRAYVDYWVGRLDFGIAYLDAVKLVREAAVAEAGGRRAEALRHGEAALNLLRRATQAQARIARDQSDRGAVAVLNEHACRALESKLRELRQV